MWKGGGTVSHQSSSYFDAIMRGRLSSLVVSLLLLVCLGQRVSSQLVDIESCVPRTDTMSESSVVADAGSTGFISYTPVRFHQFYDQKCHTEKAQRYRTADGSCNHPLNYGSANTPFRRLLPPLYGDGINTPRTHGKDGYPLPSATEVSRLVHTEESCSKDDTMMLMQWGQFADHDLTLTPVTTTKKGSVVCCGPNGTIAHRLMHPDCFPIHMSPKDADKRFRGQCMSLVRSLPARSLYGRQIVPREQVNMLTAFLDGSNIYGSSREMQKLLRETIDGKPGDARVNVQPGLVAIHTMWVRLHNQLVDSLRDVLPTDTQPEELFQQARKIVVGLYQNIHYREWLPRVIGRKMIGRYRLNPYKKLGRRCAYISSVDPRIMNEFSTAAFRFGHSLIPKYLPVNDNVHWFRHVFFRPDLVFDHYDGVVKGLVSPKWRSQCFDRFLVHELTGHLFEPSTQVEGTPSHGLDLAALNIQRGRDHGLRPYNDYRKACGLEPRKSFKEFGPKIAKILKSLYRSVDDMDLFVGGLLERPVKDGAVGPTFACIIAQQFHALKYGDLFYFETDRQPGGFTDEQLQAIRGVTFAHVVCLTANITEVPEEVFYALSFSRPCAELKNTFIDFSLWKTANEVVEH